MANKKLKINVSFPQYDQYIYDFIKSQPNPSAFIRKLVEAYMNGTLGNQFLNNTMNNIGNEVSIDKINTKKRKKDDLGTGQFKPKYENVERNEIEKINDLPF